MFLNYGFKSVTMDDIAEKMGISKKTIYSSFSTKTKLVEETTVFILDKIKLGIDEIMAQEKDPITENFEIKHFITLNFKGEKSSPHFQLEKYYPKIFEVVKRKQLELVDRSVVKNLNRGIATGYYRDNIPVSLISRIHFMGLIGIKDHNLFPPQEFTYTMLMEYFLEYHLRAICTEKGLKQLEVFKANHESLT